MITLGINYTGAHDSSCALIIENKLAFAASEERFSRLKHDTRFPVYSIKEAMKFTGLKPQNIDYVVLSFSKPLDYYWFNLKTEFRQNYSYKSILYTSRHYLKNWWTSSGFKKYVNEFGKAKFLYCDHHLSHAISTYCYSGIDKSTITIIDGRGAYEASSVWYGSNGMIEPVEIVRYPNSLGLFYAKFTKFLGFEPLSDEWKVMGLAPYGSDGVSLDKFIKQNSPYEINPGNLLGQGLLDMTCIERFLGKKRIPESEIQDNYKDIAFAVQRETETAMLNFVKYAIHKTGCRNLCMAGGVVLNCKANGIISQSGLIDDMFIQPASSDEGSALGAALYPYYIFNKQIPYVKMEGCYLGTEYKNSEIKKLLDNCKIKYQELNGNYKSIAELLSSGKIIGLFNGRMEFGPRALGNRSIIADPRNPDMKEKINNSVKYRENWRPFAPSIMEEYYYDYFDTKFLSSFMVLSYPVKNGCKNNIPASVHIDGTSRPQSVSKETNPFFWNIISEFYKITRVPVILNTSFNLKGEPIVCNPTDALRTFYTSGLDCLVLQNYLITKHDY